MDVCYVWSDFVCERTQKSGLSEICTRGPSSTAAANTSSLLPKAVDIRLLSCFVRLADEHRSKAAVTHFSIPTSKSSQFWDVSGGEL
uniref:Uncharacterized protein n=1 Tax=Knipowitschia caucasica TaxID=637954 RepID=A0AAV2LGN6_KNICA